MKGNMSKESEFKMRRANAARALYTCGESALARDFEQSNEAVSFEYCEHAMRQVLKSIGPDCSPFRALALSNAIYECQTLPHLWKP